MEKTISKERSFHFNVYLSAVVPSVIISKHNRKVLMNNYLLLSLQKMSGAVKLLQDVKPSGTVKQSENAELSEDVEPSGNTEPLENVKPSKQ